MYNTMDNTIAERIIDKYFEENENVFVQHHLNSYNSFFNNGIKDVLREKNPIKIMKIQDPKTNKFQLRCNIFLGGKMGDKLYYGKPIIYDDMKEHFMYPNEARLRNMTYGITIHYDVDIDFYINDANSDDDVEPTHTITLPKIFMGRFPIMLMSELCILKGLDQSIRFELGECKNDYGGYFIIEGKEKCIISQEKFADNILYLRDSVNDLYSHSAEIRSVSEDASKPVRTVKVLMVAPTSLLTNKQIVVNIPNVRKPVPLFILMRALGVLSDKEIIETILLNMEKYSSFIDLFIPSIHDANRFFNQEVALKYIATLTKGKTTQHALDILTNYFLPHVGEMNFRNKAFFLGYMVKELLRVYTKEKKPTDRDSFKCKRVEISGSLIYDLFKEYLTLQQRNIFQKIDKEFYYKQGIYSKNFVSLIESNYKELFSERIIEEGFRKAFKGNWGAEAHTKRLGVLQDLNRLNYNSALSQLRKINLPLDASAKVRGPRNIHSSQWGIIDPFDSPDGGNVGLHKHMTIMAYISSKCSSYPLIKWLRSNVNLRLLSECSPNFLDSMCKIIVNGNWLGCVGKPEEVVFKFKTYRRSGLIPLYTSINWDIQDNIIYIFTDAGRLCRPIFYVDEEGNPSYNKKNILDKIAKYDFKWEELISGFTPKKMSVNWNTECLYLDVNELYTETSIEKLHLTQAIIEYVDTSEAESSLIGFHQKELDDKKYTHIEIHPSLILGILGNQIIYPENNPAPRNTFACGQMKQAVSLYHSNFQNRIDKAGLVLNYGQVPLVKSKFLNKINKEQHPYGENVIVAIMVYGSYNVEDSILFNEGSIKRGLFRTTYFNMYESREESSKVGNTQTDSRFTNIEKENVTGLKPGCDYGDLDEYGLIKENTMLDDKRVLIGKVVNNLSNPDISIDASVFPKKGQLGFVDKSFITDGEEGFRLAKVRVRHERIPNLGDKFCSRCGQKGTIGLIIPEESMPFSDNGIRPDIIINPHAIPSRMTIGQLVEALTGKATSIYGGFGDCTAFSNKGPKHKKFGEMLVEEGYHSSGCEILYNGETGEQIVTEIYMGPTFYMRLKHMPKDKINYRAKGPRTVLTRQTVQGRANDGGLRIGEMERDAIFSNGMSKFLQESMLVRGDDYYMAICNQTGMIAAYNDSHNIFLSPYVDGPLKFTGTLSDNLNIQNISKYGKSFSVIRIPYAFKLLMQELQTMNIQMRIITEKNINQLNNLGFSKNIETLLGEGVTVKKIIDDTRKKLSNFNPDIIEGTPDKNISLSPDIRPPLNDDDDDDDDDDDFEKKYEEKYSELSASELLGWELLGSDQQKGNVWRSLILPLYGDKQALWYEQDHDNKPPDTFPNGWDETKAIYQDGRQIPVPILIEALKNYKQPGNWEYVIDFIKRNPGYHYGALEEQKYSPESPPYQPASPPYQPTSPPYQPASPPYQPNSAPYQPASPPYHPASSPPYQPASPPYQPASSPPFRVNSSPYQPENASGNVAKENITNNSNNQVIDIPTETESESENNKALTDVTKLIEEKAKQDSSILSINNDDSDDNDDKNTDKDNEKKNIKLN